MKCVLKLSRGGALSLRCATPPSMRFGAMIPARCFSAESPAVAENEPPMASAAIAGNGWPHPDRPKDSNDYGSRFVNKRGHPAAVVYFNGLLRSDHLVAALRQKGPQTTAQLWESVREVAGIPTKSRMKRYVDWLIKQKRIQAVPGTESKSFVYHALHHPNNFFEIPENMLPISAEDGVRLPRVPRSAAPDPKRTPRWPVRQ